MTGNIGLLPLAVSLLDARCLPDSEYPDGCVHSIYFDTVRGDAYNEKVNGDNLKRKLRIRWYGGTAVDGQVLVFIELKYRIGATRRKIRKMTKAPAAWLSETSLSDSSLPKFLNDSVAKLGLPVPADLIPSIHISYRRRRYVCPVSGSRVSIDWDIMAPRVNSDFFAYTMLNPLQTVVCEFKNTERFIPPWVGNLSDAGFKLGSFSKFGTCTMLAKEGIFSL